MLPLDLPVIPKPETSRAEVRTPVLTPGPGLCLPHQLPSCSLLAQHLRPCLIPLPRRPQGLAGLELASPQKDAFLFGFMLSETGA